MSIIQSESENNINGRLVGESSTPHEFPWLAVVNVGSKSLGGSLLSDRHVVTAASALYGYVKSVFYVCFPFISLLLLAKF